MSAAQAAAGSGAPEVEALLVPLPEGGGAGSDLRFDPAYKAIAEARREENARLPQGVWKHEAKRADWAVVERACREVLCGRGKDLQVACWLTEAWVQRLGYAGIAPGLRLLAGLCERFWESVHPLPDEGDLAPRLGPFEWLNARLPVLIRDLPVARPASDPMAACTWTDYVNAHLLESLRQRDAPSVERSEAAGAVTLAAFQSARAQTDPAWWRAMEASLREARLALSHLNAVLEQKCGRDAPGLGAIDNVLGDILSFASVARAETEVTVPTIPPVPAPPRERPPLAAPARAPLPEARGQEARATRADIYRQLAVLGDALHALEPHSPVPYLIRRAVSWGGLSLAELVLELSRSGFDLAALVDVLGLAEMPDAAETSASQGSM